MGEVVFVISMSLDGFITGPDVSAESPLGRDGERLHDWMFDRKTDPDAEIVDETYARTGAIIIGKRMFDLGEGPWGDPPPFHMPVFIVTHEARQPIVKQGGTTYTFVSDGIDAALEQAKAAAGDKNVGVWGGGNTFRQYLAAGLLDEMQIHLIPVLLGDGVRLFDGPGPGRIGLEQTGTVETPSATHLRFRVVK